MSTRNLPLLVMRLPMVPQTTQSERIPMRGTFLTLVAIFLAHFTQSCGLLAADTAESTSEETVKTATQEEIAYFESKIRPLLLHRCVECHSDENPESGLSLESRAGLMRGGKLGKAVVPMKPKESLLISAINHDEFLKMPPKDKLATAELALLTKWVAMGAPWPELATPTKGERANEADQGGNEASPDAFSLTDQQKSFWSFQPLRRPEVPRPKANDWNLSPIDSFILQKLEAKGLTPSPPASKRDLIRRATFDLTGIPPTEEEIDSFLNDASPNAFEAVVERLLASPRYGEKWGRHWLDVARYAESNGLDENIAYANAFRYRDYVISSFNSDKPYDRFVQEQIAGDLLEEDRNDQQSFDRFIATGFLAIGAKMLAEDDPVKMQMDIIDEQLNTLCQAFMGLTIGCARCHDHKFDPIPATDYYALAGIFKSTKTMENHKVVAKWFERPLASPAELEKIRSIERDIETSKAALTKLQKDSRARVTKELKNSIADYLVATVELNEFETQAKQLIGRGMQTEDKAYPVSNGYALIEAEGFQRGGAIRDSENYGKDIGVLLSNGTVDFEFDLNVATAGRYAIELRYASKDRRPLKIRLDGVEVEPAAATDTTAGWSPDNQAWFLGGFLDLKEGSHILRFESRAAIPHLDKIALVFQSEEAWPFDNEPFSLTRWNSRRKLSVPALSLWRSYLNNLQMQTEQNSSTRRAFFDLWLRMRDIKTDFANAAKEIYSQLEGDSPLRQITPAILRQTVLARRPESLAQLADVYQATIQQLLTEDEEGKTKDNKETDEKDAELVEIGKLRDELKSNSSPLAGPKKDIDRFYSGEERAKAAELTSALAVLEQRKPNLPMAMGTTEAQPEDLKVHLRGSHVVLGKLVSRQFPKFLAGENQAPLPQSTSGRLELARWMTQPDHPLTSRVMANRIWHWHFGRGIVSSVDNFGMLGLQPSHPELLDWLASEFVDSRWSIKHLHRTIMLSQTYQMGTQFQSAAAELDPENELRWRFQRRRLTAEETRDSILSIGSGIDNTMYGSLMSVENHTYVNTTGGAGKLDYSSARRSVYLPIIRSGVFDILQTLDFPDPAMINGSRQTSTVAPQALLMMNSDLVFEQSKNVVDQWMSQAQDDAQRISVAYHRILQRSPSLDEIIAAANFVQNVRKKLSQDSSSTTSDQANSIDWTIWQSLCRALISSNEFSYVE
jgi:Protein of unknown function (DUF1549)/Protein of unknown function (DUF1553)/Planctomycete cytochrome C